MGRKRRRIKRRKRRISQKRTKRRRTRRRRVKRRKRMAMRQVRRRRRRRRRTKRTRRKRRISQKRTKRRRINRKRMAKKRMESRRKRKTRRKELVKFENGSYPLQTPIDIQSLQNENYQNENKNDKDNLEAFKIQKLQQSIQNNELTQNGTVIFDSQKNILQILGKQTATKNKRKSKDKTKGATQGRTKRMKHIPIFCPPYPDNLLYKNTPIYYKGMSHHDNEQKNDSKNTADAFEKTRNCLIKNSNLFSTFNQRKKGTKRKLKMNGNLTNGIGKPPQKRQKLCNGKSKTKSDKMENDEDDEEEHQIIHNPYANM